MSRQSRATPAANRIIAITTTTATKHTEEREAPKTAHGASRGNDLSASEAKGSRENGAVMGRQFDISFFLVSLACVCVLPAIPPGKGQEVEGSAQRCLPGVLLSGRSHMHIYQSLAGDRVGHTGHLISSFFSLCLSRTICVCAAKMHASLRTGPAHGEPAGEELHYQRSAGSRHGWRVLHCVGLLFSGRIYQPQIICPIWT